VISPGPSVVHLAEFVNGNPFTPDDLGDQGLPVVRIRQLLDDTADQEFADPPSRAVVIDDGDLIFSWSATLAVRRWHRGRALLNQHLFRVDPRPGVEKRWLGYALEVGIERLKPLMHGSAMTHITIDMLRSLTVALPLPNVQCAIANYLDAETARIDALIEKKRRMAELLEQRFRARQVALLTGTDYVHRVPNPLLGSLPAHWEAKRMKYCTTNVTVGVVVNPSTYFVDDGIPFVHGTDVREGLIDRSDLKRLSAESNELLAKSKLRRGDVVAMRVGYPGRAAIVPDDLDGANCASVLIFRKSRAFHPDLLAEFLNSPLGRLQIESVQYGAAQGVMNVSDAVDLVLPVPPQEEQGRVASLLQEARVQWQTAAALLGQQVDLLAEHRQALITAAVTGELDIPGVAA